MPCSTRWDANAASTRPACSYGPACRNHAGDSGFSDEVMDKCDVFLTPGGIFGSEGNELHPHHLSWELLKKATDNIIAKFGK